MTANTNVHTCSYYCERPECIRRQRDELRDRMESALAAPPSAPVGVEDIAVELERYADCPGSVEAVLRQFLTGDGYIAECDIPHIVAALTAQPAINGYTCTVPDDCETLNWRGQILSMNELASVAQPAVGEEIMVNAAHGVFTLPLQPSGLSSGPRFVVHVPPPEQPAAPSGEAVAWLRMTPDGTPDWAEDCIGSDDKFLDPEMASDGYYLQPLYAAPQQPVAVDEAMVDRAGQALYGTDWGSFEGWEADQLRRKVRAVLTAALAAQQQEPTT